MKVLPYREDFCISFLFHLVLITMHLWLLAVTVQ